MSRAGTVFNQWSAVSITPTRMTASDSQREGQWACSVLGVSDGPSGWTDASPLFGWEGVKLRFNKPRWELQLFFWLLQQEEQQTEKKHPKAGQRSGGRPLRGSLSLQNKGEPVWPDLRKPQPPLKEDVLRPEPGPDQTPTICQSQEHVSNLQRVVVQGAALRERGGRGGAEAVVGEVDQRHLTFGRAHATAAALPRAQLQTQRSAQLLQPRWSSGVVLVFVVVHHRVVEGLWTQTGRSGPSRRHAGSKRRRGGLTF